MKIPDGWIETKIGRVADVNPALPCKPKAMEKVSFLGMADIGSGEILLRRTRLTHQVASGYTQFADNDILVGKITPCFENGKGCLCTDLEGGVGFGSTEFLVLRAKKDVAPAFLFQHTISEEFRRIGTKNMVGSAGQKRVQPNFLRSYPILLPPLPEQVEIAQVLTAWDEAISQVSALIADKARLRQGLMQQLLTGERRFPEFEATEKKQKTKYGPRPEDWIDLPIREFAFEVRQKNSDAEQMPVLSCTKYAGLVDSLAYFGKQIYSKSLAAYKVVRRNQFAYATNHIEEGSIGLLTEIEAGVVSPMYTVFGLTDKVHPPFLYALFKTEMYRQIFASNTSASVDRRGSLRWRQFSKIHVSLPSVAEQKKISSVLDTLTEEIQLLEAQLQALQVQKRGLMQILLSGQVRVGVLHEQA